jgi:RNA polymerase sigma-70 factor (ECF subfamily)
MNATPFLPSAATARSARSRAIAVHDTELVRRFNAGDETAFDEIVARHRGALFQIALALLHNQGDAEEMAQDAFIRAHRALRRFRGDSSLLSWLHRIVRNLSMNRYWYFFRRRRHLTDSFDRALGHDGHQTLGDIVPSNAPGPVREATRREFSGLVGDCIAKLNPAQREILELSGVRGQAYAEIATALGIIPATVKSRIARARKSLRALLLEAYDTSSHRPATATNTLWFETARPGEAA